MQNAKWEIELYKVGSRGERTLNYSKKQKFLELA